MKGFKYMTEADCFISEKRFRGHPTLEAARSYAKGLRRRKDFSDCWIYLVDSKGRFHFKDVVAA